MKPEWGTFCILNILVVVSYCLLFIIRCFYSSSYGCSIIILFYFYLISLESLYNIFFEVSLSFYSCIFDTKLYFGSSLYSFWNFCRSYSNKSFLSLLSVVDASYLGAFMTYTSKIYFFFYYSLYFCILFLFL